MKKLFDRRGAVLVEGAATALFIVTLCTGLLDLAIGMVIAEGVEQATSRAAKTMTTTRSTTASLRVAQESMPSFSTRCLSVTGHYWTSLVGVDLSSGSSFAGAAPSDAVLVSLQVRCQWGWLTPAIRWTAGSSVVFAKASVVALE